MVLLFSLDYCPFPLIFPKVCRRIPLLFCFFCHSFLKNQTNQTKNPWPLAHHIWLFCGHGILLHCCIPWDGITLENARGLIIHFFHDYLILDNSKVYLWDYNLHQCVLLCRKAVCTLSLLLDVPFPFLKPHRVFCPPLMGLGCTLSSLAFMATAATYPIVCMKRSRCKITLRREKTVINSSEQFSAEEYLSLLHGNSIPH